MNDAIASLLALIAALSAATANPVDAGKLPDRPAIVAPASAGAKSLPTSSGKIDDKGIDPAKKNEVEIKGVITAINGNTITVNGQLVTLGTNTKVEGKLQVGAAVQVEGTSQNGTIAAIQVQVKKPDDKKDDSKGTSIGSNDSKGKSGSDDKNKSDNSGDKSKSDNSGDKSKGDNSGDKGKGDSSSDKGKSGSDDDKSDN